MMKTVLERYDGEKGRGWLVGDLDAEKDTLSRYCGFMGPWVVRNLITDEQWITPVSIGSEVHSDGLDRWSAIDQNGA